MTDDASRRKTGSLGGQWVALDHSTKPPPVNDPYRYWSSPPPEVSARCVWWLRQVEAGWLPNRRLRGEGYDSRAHWYGVWLWEYFNLIEPAIARHARARGVRR